METDLRELPSGVIQIDTATRILDPAVLREAVDWDKLLAFTDKQLEALNSMYRERYILYGGARGGGKSYFLRWAAVDFLVTLYQEKGLRNVRVGLFCETYPDLRDRQISKIKLEFPSWMGRLADTKDQGLAFILADHLGGGIIALRNLDDPSKYQSAEFAGIFVDELTKTTLDTFNILRGSLRWPHVEHTVFVGATNPGSIGHAWVKGLWIDHVFPKEMEALRQYFAFIQSLPSDNPHLAASYWEDLNTLPENLRKAWVLGLWDTFEGQAFQIGPQHIVENFEIPDYWPRTLGIDWGYSKPFAAIFVAQNPITNQHIAYDELYQVRLTDQEQAMLIRATSEGQYIRYRFGDPAMFTPDPKSPNNIVSSADVYKRNGVWIFPGENNRLSGKRKVDRLLQTSPYGEPGLIMMKRCKNLIRTISALPYAKDKKGEDVDTNAEDHAYDALRYALSAERADALILPSQPDTSRPVMHPLVAALKRRDIRWPR